MMGRCPAAATAAMAGPKPQAMKRVKNPRLPKRSHMDPEPEESTLKPKRNRGEPKPEEKYRQGEVGSVVMDYKPIKITGDGRCLFRSVGHGWVLGSGGVPLDETDERELADDLRRRVINELSKQRPLIEDFLEDHERPFERYLEKMSNSTEWGGDLEIRMLSTVLKWPIAVYVRTDALQEGCPLVLRARYGDEYQDSVRVPINIFHRSEHFELLQIHR